MRFNLRKFLGRNSAPTPPAAAAPQQAQDDPEPPAVSKPADWLARDTDAEDSGNDDSFHYNPRELPLPSKRLRATVSGPDLGRFLYIGSAWADVCSRYLPTDRRATILDIGCGVGKMARFFALNPLVDYVGFDIYLPAITWCRREFPRLYGQRFRFEHFDGKSAMYNPNGAVASQSYGFPADDASVDLAVGASIFTHLYEDDMKRYLSETARTLKPSGVAVISIHTLDEIDKFFPGSHSPAGKRIVGNEQVMLVEPDYFVELGQSHGLGLLVLPGRLCGQELVVFRKETGTH